MKAYTYSDAEIIRAFRFTPEQLERARVKIAPAFEPTNDARWADFFWTPLDLGHAEAYHGGVKEVAASILKLPHYPGNGKRHVFYFCSDGPDPVGIPSIMFRASFWKGNRDENAVAWPYAVDDFVRLVTNDFDSLPYDVSFVGSRVSSKSRIESFDSVRFTPELIWFLDDSKMHWGKIENTAIGAQRRALFVQSLIDSKMVLAARGGGLSCYRFFEAMSAGRVPILLADDWVLPSQELIDWDRCILQIPEHDAKHTGRILVEYLKGKTNAELAAMGQYGRVCWENYLAPAMWPEMMEWHIKRRLAA